MLTENKLLNMLNESLLASQCRNSQRSSLENLDDFNERQKETSKNNDGIQVVGFELDAQLSSINPNEQVLNQSALRDALTIKSEFTPTPDGNDMKMVNQKLEAFQDAIITQV